jgi:putative hydrolase of the HAD superfamily
MNTASREKFDALLFDLGKVVIDIDFERVWASWARDAGCTVEKIRRRIGADDAYLRYECGAIPLEEYFTHLRGALGVTLSDAQLLAGWNAIFVGEMPGIAKVLEAAKARFPLYVFSNTNGAHEACWSVDYAGVLSHFKKLFVSSTIGLRKPDRAAFEHVVAEMGVPAARVLFFDDLAENVAGARAAGLQAVQVAGTQDVVAALAPYVPGLNSVYCPRI